MGLGNILGSVGGFALGGPLGAFAGNFVGDELEGLLDGFGVDKISESGAFPGLEELGSEYSQFLLDRLRTDPRDTDTFRLGTEAIRDATGGVASAQRQRLGNAANTGGFLDSGSVTRGLADIDRAELESFANSERDLLLALIARQDEAILPYLSAGANEALGVGTANIGVSGFNRNFALDAFSEIRDIDGIASLLS